MLDRTFFRGLYHLHPDLVAILGSITLAADGSVSAYDIPGVSAVTKTGTGLYRLQLSNQYPELLGAFCLARKANGAGVRADVHGANVGAATPYVDLVTTTTTVAATAATTVAAPTANTTVAAPTANTAVTPAVSCLGKEDGDVSDPSSASTQGAGAAGVTEWRVDVAAVRTQIQEGGAEVRRNLPAVPDVVVHDTTNLLQIGESCVAAIVVKADAGVVSLDAVKGAVATTGAEVPPSKAVINAAVGHGNWLRLGNTTINRTADVVVTQAHDNEAGKTLCRVAATATTTVDAPTATTTVAAPSATTTITPTVTAPATDPASVTLYPLLLLRATAYQP